MVKLKLDLAGSCKRLRLVSRHLGGAVTSVLVVCFHHAQVPLKNPAPASIFETPDQVIAHLNQFMAEAEDILGGRPWTKALDRLGAIKARLAGTPDQLNQVYASARVAADEAARRDQRSPRRWRPARRPRGARETVPVAGQRARRERDRRALARPPGRLSRSRRRDAE